MKNRIIPFGYIMQNGVIQIEPTESKAVREIFQAYLNGSSLLAIANLMSSQGVSYNGVSSAWNKNMVKRILENEKYLGRNGYPAIIDEDMFCRANMRKKIKSTTVVEISEELKAIRSLTYCTECGHKQEAKN
ncbi:recombinase family protein [Porcipelethomonas sp.]|uniref:recombinase family protein n=1 Tax=Porcipelethomonas sp. TaxID=2981675 RepID=UPI00307989F6